MSEKKKKKNKKNKKKQKKTNKKTILSLELCGETGLRTFSPQVPYLQGYNNVNFTLSNVLVTEVCLIQSHIVFMMSVHLNITIQR